MGSGPQQPQAGRSAPPTLAALLILAKGLQDQGHVSLRSTGHTRGPVRLRRTGDLVKCLPAEPNP